jgi:tyrosyl-tRNA synthetase
VADKNPILDFSKHIIFRKFKTLKIERKPKFGGDIEITSYEELEKLYKEGKLHPLDLKVAVAEHLEKLVKPIREHFEKNSRAKELYEILAKSKITR